jgi:uncharacterized protein (DUF427 family)
MRPPISQASPPRPATPGEIAVKLPGPDHPITIEFNPKRVRVLYQGHLIADTRAAMTLKEAAYPPVQYIPREDVEMAVLSRTEHTTYCPYKGDASYYNIVRDGVVADNAVWSYEDPYPAMEQIRGLLAFYPNQAQIIEIDEGFDADTVREVIEHTDSGSGRSQLEHWPPSDS